MFDSEESTYDINVVPLNFRVEHVPIKDKPGEFKPVEKVDLVKKGSNGECTPWPIKSLQQDTILWPVIRPSYERWLEGQEDPIEGTPIDCLPFIPAGLVQHFRMLHILSAEDLAGVTDADLERIGQGGRVWREKAKAYVEAKTGDAAFASINADLKEENRMLRDDIEELKKQVNSLVAGAETVEQPIKRGPGRPRKVK